MKKQKLLIIGNKGFIGKNLVKYFRKLNEYEVTGKSYHCPDETFDLIINCAGRVHVSLDELVVSNVTSPPYYLLNYIKRNPNVKFLHLGSSSEYGNYKIPFSEDLLCIPESDYAITKLLGTSIVKRIAEMGNQANIIRPFSVYGNFEYSYKFIPTVVKAINSFSPLVLYPGSHDWIYIKDFCELCYLILKSDFTGHIFNAGTGVNTTNEEVVNILVKILNKPVTTTKSENSYRSYDSDFWCADISKVNSFFNWKPKYNLQEGLNDYLRK